MRAAILKEYGAIPEIGDFEEPTGPDVVEVLAAGLNPIDLRVASGTLASRKPDLPSVVGSEGIGRTQDGRRVYFNGASFAEKATARDTVDVPDGVDDAAAVAYGVAGLAAWLALEQRGALSAGERVLILGASGTVGLIAVQAAKLLGAARVVAAARSEAGLKRAAELGADATVSLAGDDLRFDEEFDLVFDPLWGAPATAAVKALAFRGRLVQLGQSAGGEATFASADIRFKELSIIGHTNFASPIEVRAEALRTMWRHAAAGELTVDCETVPLDEVASAWQRQADGPGVKLVLVP